MKKHVEVFWTPYYHQDTASGYGYEYACVPPKAFYPMLFKARGNVPYLKCPAFVESCKNDFVVCAPFDLNLKVNAETNTLTTDRFGQDFYDNFIINRNEFVKEGNPFLCTLPPKYLFYSKDSVEIEIMDLPIITSKSSENFKVIRAAFNIGKWIRPVELAVELIDATKPITFIANEPLFLVRFKTQDNMPVKFTRVELTNELHGMVLHGGALKRYCPNLKLKQMYELAQERINLFLKGSK